MKPFSLPMAISFLTSTSISSLAIEYSWQAAEKVRRRRSRIAQNLNVPKKVRLGPSLAAALPDGLFEPPASH
jgi:hypothetical protein